MIRSSRGVLLRFHLKEPPRVAREEFGVTVGVVNPHPPKRRSLVLKGTFFKQLRQSALAASQFLPTLTDDQGTIVKPANW